MGDVLWPVTSIHMASLATVIDDPVPLDTPGVSEAVVVPLPSRQVYGTKTGVVLDPRRVQLGRQKEMDQMYEHGVVTVVRQSAATGGKHIRGDWGVEDWKGDDIRCRFVAKEINTYKREDCAQGAPPLIRIILSLAATKRPSCNKTRYVGLWDISVAFFNPDVDELIYVDPPSDLCPKGFCWRLEKAMNGTRRASLLWGKLVCEVMVECGCIEVMVIPMMFRNTELDFLKLLCMETTLPVKLP